MNPKPEWSVLDVGCGPGTLAIPLAERVSSVTAMDFSQTMLDILMEKAARNGITNITPCRADMETDWASLPFGPHDVVIASRSLIARDLKAMLTTLTKYAHKKVLVAALTGTGPFDSRIITATGRPHIPGPDYIYVVNQLYRMGIDPRLDYTVQSSTRAYKSSEDAVEESRWMIDEMTMEEEARLLSFFRDNMIQDKGSWFLPDTPPVRWAVIQWEI